MLVHLSVHNYAIVEHLDLELDRGMSVITGETGAGKSIMLDALGLTLGDRADSGVLCGAGWRSLRRDDGYPVGLPIAGFAPAGAFDSGDG